MIRNPGATHFCSRYFSHTPCLAKANPKERSKGKPDSSKSNAARSPDGSSSSSSAAAAPDGRPKPNPEDPFELADLEFSWKKGADHFEDLLKKMRAGGRFNPDVIGELRVRPDKKLPESFPLHELAAVVPKGGRNISVLVHEEAFVKPIMSAIQNSADFNQQPQRSEDNELELMLKIEPEKKEGLVKRAKETCHSWREQIRAETHKRDVLAKKWHKDGHLTSDDKARLEKELKKQQDKRMAVVDTKEKEILQHIATRDGR